MTEREPSPTPPPDLPPALRRAAKRRGVALCYTDTQGARHDVATDTLDAILSLLGDAPKAPPGAPPPVLVAWDGALAPLEPWGPLDSRQRRVALELRAEDGTDLGRLMARDGSRDARLRCAGSLPFGVHELLVDGSHVAHVVSAPVRADGRAEVARAWGVFAPTYAIRDERGAAAGDLTALERLGTAVARWGGGAIATLPLLAELATADDGHARQQPYSPLSRMFWNEAYLDIARVPELADTAHAGKRPAPDRPAAVADLAAVASAARPALDAAVERLDQNGGTRRATFAAFVAARPELVRYARYRAAVETAGPLREAWPAAWRAGRIAPGEVPATAERRHLFAQWAMDEQLASVSTGLGAAGVGLVMDLPIGCAADGFDPWAFPEVYATGASLGAPPDDFFTAGQDWGFPPPRPDTDRRNGYPVLRACLAHSLRHASVLRVDHVLGWSRLWWVPSGAPAHAGAYVSYPLDELIAVANLEAWRHSARLVGEDLGTVQRGLRPKLAAHGVAGMRVALFELGLPARKLRPPSGTVAYVDTHDTATFAGWFSAADVATRHALGLVDAEGALEESRVRVAVRDAAIRRLQRAGKLGAGVPGSVAVHDVLAALLSELGTAPADLVLVALEDLWGELDPQNVPGTTNEHANFCRRFARTLEELTADEDARRALAGLDAARRETTGRMP